MKIITKYDIGDYIYLKTDSEHKERMIIQIQISVNGYYYSVVCGTEESSHYEIEMSSEKDIVKKFNE